VGPADVGADEPDDCADGPDDESDGGAVAEDASWVVLPPGRPNQATVATVALTSMRASPPMSQRQGHRAPTRPGPGGACNATVSRSGVGLGWRIAGV
jgi:hypothetical protein